MSTKTEPAAVEGLVAALREGCSVPADGLEPTFSRQMGVTLIEPPDVSQFGLLASAFLGMSPGFALLVWSSDHEGFWCATLSVLGAVLCFAGCLAGIFLPVLAPWRKNRRPPILPARVRVAATKMGLKVDGYRLLPWADIESWEGVPDSDNYLLIHARPWALLVDGDAEGLARALAWQVQRAGQADFVFLRAIVFRRTWFYSWMTLGYLAAVLLLVLTLPDNNKGIWGDIAMLFVVAPLTAWLIWAIPLSDLGVGANRLVRQFQIKGQTLIGEDIRRQIALDAAVCTLKRARGLVYDFEYVSIRPARGRTLCLIPIDQDAIGLLRKLTPARDSSVGERPDI